MKKSEFTQEFKEKIIKEVSETGSPSAVAAKYNLPVVKIYAWTNRHRAKMKKGNSVTVAKLQKELHVKDVQIQILKELLKKTNHAWLNE